MHLIVLLFFTISVTVKGNVQNMKPGSFDCNSHVKRQKCTGFIFCVFSAVVHRKGCYYQLLCSCLLRSLSIYMIKVLALRPEFFS